MAGLESREGAFVEGVVYELDEKDLDRLDGYEGVADRRYERSEVEVTALPGGEPIRAWCYFAVPEPGGPFAPSPAYARAILRGADAEENGLSAEGVKQLHEMVEQSMHSSTAPGR